MKKIQSIAMMMFIALTGTAGLTACSSENVEDNSNVVYDENGKAGVKPEFVISIPRKVVGPTATRQGDDITQNAGSVSQFRGLDNIRLVPFAAEPTPTSSKLADIMRLSPITTLSSPGSINYKVYADEFVPVGTKHFLFYAKAPNGSADAEISTISDKFRYGILNYSGLTDAEFTNPNSIGFSLVQINTSTAQQQDDATGKALVKLLTDMANTSVSGVAAPHDKWSTTTSIVMARLYKNFTAITTGSSNSVAAILSRVYASLKNVQSNDAARSLADKIKKQIEDVVTVTPTSGVPASLKSAYTGYPGNIGLPDGAARIKWNNTSKAFVDVTADYGQGNQVDIRDYVYPAALWYYISTPLKAADAVKSPNYTSAGNWDGVINSVYSGAADEVGASTLSVALTKPVDYGVGRLETSVAMGSGTFYDRYGQSVATGSGYTLKGILLGGQNSVGYDFSALGNENLTIYDCDMDGRTITVTPGQSVGADQTLALETHEDQTVYAALELVNGGEDFQGADGLIPAGGTFYLTAKLVPTDATNYVSGKRDKIIIKDHVTKLTVTIKNGSALTDKDADGDGDIDPFISDPEDGGPGWDTDGDGKVDVPADQDEGLGGATNGIPDLSSPGVELGTSVNLEWQEGLELTPSV